MDFTTPGFSRLSPVPRDRGCYFPLSAPVQVHNGSRLAFLPLTQIPVQGYDTKSGLRSRSGRPQMGTRRPRIIACCDVAASARATTPAGSFNPKSVEPALSPSLDRPGPQIARSEVVVTTPCGVARSCIKGLYVLMPAKYSNLGSRRTKTNAYGVQRNIVIQV